MLEVIQQIHPIFSILMVYEMPSSIQQHIDWQFNISIAMLM